MHHDQRHATATSSLPSNHEVPTVDPLMTAQTSLSNITAVTKPHHRSLRHHNNHRYVWTLWLWVPSYSLPTSTSGTGMETLYKRSAIVSYNQERESKKSRHYV